MSKRKKYWRRDVQAYFLIKCSELLKEGFTMLETLQFLKLLMPKEKSVIDGMIRSLEKGKRFDECLQNVGFSEQVISQIFFSQEHGRFHQVLFMSGQAMRDRLSQLKKLQKLLVYPCILIIFVFVLLIGIRQFFLPHIDKMATETQQPDMIISVTVFLIREFPMILMCTIGIMGAVYSIWHRVYAKQNVLMQQVWLSRIPIIKKWVKLYYSGYMSQELSYFFENGYGLQQMIMLLKTGNTSLLWKEFALFLESHAFHGHDLAYSIAQLPFLKSEMVYMIQHGEKISQLPIQLQLFSKECFALLQDDIEKKMTWVQPIIFLCIGLIVMFVYIALMLPMLQTVNTLFVY